MRGTTFKVDKKDDQLIQITAIWEREMADNVQNKIQSYFQ
jgi:hypothetical protein